MKKILALLLAALLCLSLLAACGSAASDTAEEAAASAPAAEETAKEETAEEETEDPAEESKEPAAEETGTETEDDIVSINFYLTTVSTIQSEDSTRVQDAINAITEPEIGVSVNLTTLPIGEYESTVNMAIAGGEVIDLCSVYCIPPVDFSSMYSVGSLMDISGYLEEYGQDLVNEVGDYLNAYRLNGGIYGVPCFRNYATSQYLIMRKDILEELGLTDTAYALTSFTDYEALLEQVSASYPSDGSFYMIGGAHGVLYQSDACGVYQNQDDWADADIFDCLGDTLYMVHAAGDGSGTVTSLYDTEAFEWTCAKTAEWYNKGWVYPEAFTTTEGVDTLAAQDMFFSYFVPCELGAETQKTASTGFDMAAVKIIDSMVSTTSVVKFGCGVPVTAEEPEAAVKFLNLLYTSSDLMNLLDWGVAGEDYEITETGEAAYVGDATSAAYHVQDFIFGNYFLAAPWQGDGSDFRAVSKTALDEAPISPYMGFALDSSELSNEVAALTAVQNEYMYSLTCGLYTEEAYDEYLSALQDAGLDTYIAAVQEQLNTFMNS